MHASEAYDAKLEVLERLRAVNGLVCFAQKRHSDFGDGEMTNRHELSLAILLFCAATHANSAPEALCTTPAERTKAYFSTGATQASIDALIKRVREVRRYEECAIQSALTALATVNFTGVERQREELEGSLAASQHASIKWSTETAPRCNLNALDQQSNKTCIGLLVTGLKHELDFGRQLRFDVQAIETDLKKLDPTSTGEKAAVEIVEVALQQTIRKTLSHRAESGSESVEGTILASYIRTIVLAPARTLLRPSHPSLLLTTKFLAIETALSMGQVRLQVTGKVPDDSKIAI